VLAGWAAAALLGRGACSCAMPEPDPAQGQQVIIGVDVDQHRLMPCIAQKLGAAMRLRADLVRDPLPSSSHGQPCCGTFQKSSNAARRASASSARTRLATSASSGSETPEGARMVIPS
jgi:hypothetical protein